MFAGTDCRNPDPIGAPTDPAAGIDIAQLETAGIFKGNGHRNREKCNEENIIDK
jgi:hypothetical protein